MTRLRFVDRPDPADVPADPAAFLEALGGATAVRVPGRDRSRLRIVVTLLHGNEPSGFRAIHAWLREPSEPAVDALLVIANVEAALAPPGFANRMLPDRRDLNRCFLGPFDDADGALAREVGMAGRREIEARYALDVVGRRLVEILASLGERGAG